MKKDKLSEVVSYLSVLADRAASKDADAAIIKKINEANSKEERTDVCERFSQVPPPSSMPEESPMVAAILVIQKWLRELGLAFPDPPESVIGFFKEKDAVGKLLPS